MYQNYITTYWQEIDHYENSPFYEKIINEDKSITYIYDQLNARKLQWKYASDRIVSDKNYLGFRNGPMPGIHHYGGGWWHKYKGDHNVSPKTEYTSNITTLEYSDELYEEYGIQIKIKNSRTTWMKYIIYGWGEIHCRDSKGRGWKRSRKKKQWM